MSEFVECQNCGKRFFAENLDCPYCKDQQDLHDLIDEVQGTTSAPPHGMGTTILMTVFMLLLGAVAVFALIAAVRTPVVRTRVLLGVQAAFAALVLAGLVRRRRWGRHAAVAYVVANAAAGVVLWGPYPASLLLFVIPLLSRPVRAYLNR